MIKPNKIVSTAFLTSAILITIGRSHPLKAQDLIAPYPLHTATETHLAKKQTKLVQEVGTIGITVSDMERSIAFYSEALSFTKISDLEVYGEEYEQL